MNILLATESETAANSLKNYLQEIKPHIIAIGKTKGVNESIHLIEKNSNPLIIFIDTKLTKEMSWDVFQTISNKNVGSQTYKRRFLVKKGKKYYPIPSNEIAYFTRAAVILLVTDGAKKFIYDIPLEEIEEKLNPLTFFRVNRQFIINYSSIKCISPASSNRLKLNIAPDPGQPVFVSQGKVKAFKAWLDR
jgi:DNA-binding LytR/AlgR family response regulator